MAILGDYHTHTKYSHGKGTVMDNVKRAHELGLKEVAITDHGFRHMMYNVSRTSFPSMIEDIRKAREAYPDVTVYLGMETNLVSRKGTIDLVDTDMPLLDLVVCGYHKFAKPDSIADYWKYFIPNMMYNITKISSVRLQNRNTDAFLRAIERYDIDILSHPNNGIRTHVLEIAKACKYYGTYVELNGKGNYMTDKEIEKMIEMGVDFIIDSDAHSPDRVGEISKPQAIVDRLHIPEERLANWDKLPRFRSRIKKGLYE